MSKNKKSKPKTTIGVNIEGGKLDAQSVQNLAAGIAVIFEKGHDTHQDQETIQLALKQLGMLGSVHGASVSGSTIHFDG